MDDAEFDRLKLRLFRLLAEVQALTEQVFDEVARRESGETGTVTPLFTRDESGDDGA